MSDILDRWKVDGKGSLAELFRKIAATITNAYPSSMVILFGSYARGEQHEESDLDICVLVPVLTERRIDMKVEIRGLIGDMCYDYDLSFDLKLYTYDEFESESQYRSTLQHTIKTEGVILSA